MAEKNNKKGNALLERFLNIVDSVSEESYSENEENTAAEVTEAAEANDDVKLFDKAESYQFDDISEDEFNGDTRKINSEVISQLLDNKGLDVKLDENGNTMVFKNSSEAGDENSDNSGSIEETHVFAKIGDSDNEEEEPVYDDDDEIVYEARDFRPVRRNRHYRTGCMGGIMYFIVVVCISVALAAIGWQAANDVLSLDKELVSAEITVDENFTIEDVAEQLKEKGIIEYPFLFKIFAGFSSEDKKITPGTYTLSSHLDYRAIITNLRETSGPLKTVEVTIPEGKTMMQTFQILEDNGVCKVDELLECSMNYEFDFDFLSPEKLGTEKRLEGFLFPDTYEFYVDSDPEDAIRKFLNNFEYRVKEHMFLKAEEMGYTFDEIMTIASMIEMEAASDSERTTIASVIYNRLNSSDFPYLQIDATVQYALGERKEQLSNDDLQVDDPYNTYLYEGLPPGPISNPGITSIGAALNPENTNYYFYALSTSGTHKFFTYYSSFQEFVNSSEYGG